MTEIQQADPRARRAAIGCIAVGTILGAAAISLFESYRQSLFTRVGVVCLLLIALCTPMFLFAAWMWRYSVRIVRTNRHPPEGARLLRDTPVVRGATARRYGLLYKGLAVLFALAALFMAGATTALWHIS